MLAEVDQLTPIEKELCFTRWCKDRSIKRFLFDLDDTICPTRAVFGEVMAQAYDYLAVNAPALPREEWKDEVESIDDRLFEKIGVDPIRWDFVVEELAGKFALKKTIQDETKAIFQRIYETPMRMLGGAEEGLAFIKKVETPIGIVTHGGDRWTWLKYNWLGLGRFVDWDDVYRVDVKEHKTPDAWRRAINYFGLRPEGCAVVGDSPRSDINPAWEIGVRNCFLVEDPNQWGPHNQPVPAGVYKISSLSQIVNAILKDGVA